jgi:hypothetical protein
MKFRLSRIIFFFLLLSCGLFISGCTRRIVEITSNPSGAVVTYNQCYIGETPLFYTVESRSGFNNKYKFCVILEGYEPGSMEFIEDEWAFDVEWVIPEKIHFDLKKKQKK